MSDALNEIEAVLIRFVPEPPIRQCILRILNAAEFFRESIPGGGGAIEVRIVSSKSGSRVPGNIAAAEAHRKLLQHATSAGRNAQWAMVRMQQQMDARMGEPVRRTSDEVRVRHLLKKANVGS